MKRLRMSLCAFERALTPKHKSDNCDEERDGHEPGKRHFLSDFLA